MVLGNEAAPAQEIELSGGSESDGEKEPKPAQATQTQVSEVHAAEKQKPSFINAVPLPAKKAKAVPKAADLLLGQSPAARRMVRQPLARPTAPALAEFHGPCPRWACIAVAVHKFPSPVGKFKWIRGCTFRHWTRPSDPAADRACRIVQLSWAVGTVSGNDASPKFPTKYCTKEVQVANGTEDAGATAQCIGEVMTQMMDDLYYFLRDGGGRLCMHNLEFEATVLEAELRRAGLVREAGRWTEIAMNGLCLMNPNLAHWILNKGKDAMQLPPTPFSTIAGRLIQAPEKLQPACARWLVLQRMFAHALPCMRDADKRE